jgi:cytoskeletal protein RodZ
MATLGQQLKAAREAGGISENEAGAATKILTRIIAAMEADDFSGMAAPTYAKGFIRLYAEYLGLNPEPLVEEYMSRHAPGPKPPVNGKSRPEKTTRPPVPFSLNLKWRPSDFHPKAWLGAPAQLFSKAWKRIPPVKDIRVLAAGIAGALVVIVLLVSITNCARRRAAENPDAPAPQVEAARRLLDEPLPDLYLVEPGKIESTSRP